MVIFFHGINFHGYFFSRGFHFQLKCKMEVKKMIKSKTKFCLVYIIKGKTCHQDRIPFNFKIT